MDTTSVAYVLCRIEDDASLTPVSRHRDMLTILDALQRQADAMGRLDWSVHYVDSTVVRAHQHAAGAQQGNPATEALGRSQGGFSTKVHLRSEGAANW